MVTIEKWYTPCGSKGPTQSGPSCPVETKVERPMSRIRAMNPNVTTGLYCNSMFDFTFYGAHQGMPDLEAAGGTACCGTQMLHKYYWWQSTAVVHDAGHRCYTNPNIRAKEISII